MADEDVVVPVEIPVEVTGPPKKGKGPKPVIAKAWKAPKTDIQKTTDMPILDINMSQHADKTVYAARARKVAVPSVNKMPAVIRGASLELPAAGAEGDEQPTPLLVVPAAERGPATTESPESVLPDAAFNEIKTAVEDRVFASPIKVTPSDRIFMPSNRRGIHEFTIQTYKSYILKKPRVDPIGDACRDLARLSATAIENFAYQEFVRDYMQRDSPYRGLLVYHGLGSGKTCTSIAAAEALHYGGMRKIFILTPATLSGNYRKELSLCGYYAFKKENNWQFIKLPDETDTSSQYVFLTNTYGLGAESVKKRGGGWVANPRGAVNFTSLSPEEQREIEAQIQEHMRARFEFIHYNGLREARIREMICSPTNLFDGAVIVVDEVHNLIRTIVGSRLDYFMKFEPRQPNYEGAFCKIAKKYRIAYGLYRLLSNAVGCKIIALSGTPIINFPHEIGVMANILAGDRRICRVPLTTTGDTKQIEDLLKRHPEVDFYKLQIARGEDESTYQELTISPVPSGKRKVVDEATGELKGFIHLRDEEATEDDLRRERDLDGWFSRVSSELSELATVGTPVFEALPQLPDQEKEFVQAFIDPEKLSVKNNIVLRARLTGLISYYRGSKKELVASVTKDEVVRLDMSDWQLGRYQEIRKEEMEGESKEDAKPRSTLVGAAGLTLFERDLYTQATKSVNSSFKIFSRASCNFVFPDGIDRPRPRDVNEAAALLGVTKEAGESSAAGDDSEGAELRDSAVVEESHDTRAFVAPTTRDAGTTEEAAEISAAGEARDGLDAEVKRIGLQYADIIKARLDELRERASDIFSPEKLPQYSPKYAAILDRIRQSKGPVLIYSQFKTLEGLGIFAIAAEAQTDPGFARLDIVKDEKGEWRIPQEFKTTGQGKERYILYTGDDPAEKREILRDIFNWDIQKLPKSLRGDLKFIAGGHPDNKAGKIARMFMITQSGAEGISLKNVRQVHMMEPFWNSVRLEQVQGRAIRICSHKDLPMAERNVEVYTYLMRFSDAQKRERRVDETIMNRDKALTTDEIIWTLLQTKKKLADQLFFIMQSAAIDCTLNALEHGTKSCFMIRSGGPLFLYDPDYNVDIGEAPSTYRETPVGAEEVSAVAASAPAGATTVAAVTAASLPPGLSGAVETRVENDLTDLTRGETMLAPVSEEEEEEAPTAPTLLDTEAPPAAPVLML